MLRTFRDSLVPTEPPKAGLVGLPSSTVLPSDFLVHLDPAQLRLCRLAVLSPL